MRGALPIASQPEPIMTPMLGASAQPALVRWVLTPAERDREPMVTLEIARAPARLTAGAGPGHHPFLLVLRAVASCGGGLPVYLAAAAMDGEVRAACREAWALHDAACSARMRSVRLTVLSP